MCSFSLKLSTETLDEVSLTRAIYTVHYLWNVYYLVAT